MRGIIYVASVIVAAALSGHAYKAQRTAPPPAQPVVSAPPPAGMGMAARPLGMQKDRPRLQGMGGMGMAPPPAGMGMGGPRNSITQSKTKANPNICAQARAIYNRIMALPLGERLAAARKAAAGRSAADIAAGRACLGL